jgi:hypothetical protein
VRGGLRSLARRAKVFFETNTSGISALNTDREVIRYASYISMEVMRVFDSQRGIYPPVLTIRYKETKPSSWKIASATKPTLTSSGPSKLRRERMLSSSSSLDIEGKAQQDQLAQEQEEQEQSVHSEMNEARVDDESSPSPSTSTLSSTLSTSSLLSRFMTTTSTTTTNSLVSITFQSYYSMDMTYFLKY